MCYIVQLNSTNCEFLIIKCGALLAVACFDNEHAWGYFKSEYKGLKERVLDELVEKLL